MPKHAAHATLERERTLSRIVADDEPVSPAALEECFGVLPLGDADFEMLANKLNMDQESAEKWIANLIRNARLNAKIDSQQGTVVMGSQHPGVFEQIVEKTKNLTARTYNLANAVIGSGKINA